MKELSFKISSITSLLMNNVNSMLLKKPSKVGYDEWESSDEVFRARMYLEGNKVTLPGRVWKGVLKEGAKRSGFKQKGKRSGYSDLVQSHLFMPEPMILEQKLTEVTREQSFVGMNGTKKVLRIWPKLETWSGILKIIVADERQFDPEILREILEFSGNFVGVGDYRPEFGRFKVEKI